MSKRTDSLLRNFLN